MTHYSALLILSMYSEYYIIDTCTYMYYRIAENFRQEKISPKPEQMYCRKNSPDLFSRSLDWAKLNSNVIYI